MGQDVHPLLQVAIFRLQQYRLLTLKGAVWVSVLTKLADHRELQEENVRHKEWVKKGDKQFPLHHIRALKGNFQWFQSEVLYNSSDFIR